MGRGMSLDDLRKTISSDDSIKNERLKKEIDEIKKNSDQEIYDLMEEIEEYKKINESIQRKCKILSLGVNCNKCKIYNCLYNKNEATVIMDIKEY